MTQPQQPYSAPAQPSHVAPDAGMPSQPAFGEGAQHHRRARHTGHFGPRPQHLDLPIPRPGERPSRGRTCRPPSVPAGPARARACPVSRPSTMWPVRARCRCLPTMTSLTTARTCRRGAPAGSIRATPAVVADRGDIRQRPGIRGHQSPSGSRPFSCPVTTDQRRGGGRCRPPPLPHAHNDDCQSPARVYCLVMSGVVFVVHHSSGGGLLISSWVEIEPPGSGLPASMVEKLKARHSLRTYLARETPTPGK